MVGHGGTVSVLQAHLSQVPKVADISAKRRAPILQPIAQGFPAIDGHDILEAR